MTAIHPDTISRRRLLRPIFVVPVLLVLAALLAFVLYYFEPQSAFLNSTAKEAAPTTVVSEDIASRTGTFFGLAHDTSGTAKIVATPEGPMLRIEGLDTLNGPDLRVILSSASGKGGNFSQDYVDLGGLKGNKGDQNYAIPAGTDLSKFKSVAIWCRRFDATFGAADLSAA